MTFRATFQGDVVAISDDDMNAHSLGRIVFWSLSGDVKRDDLIAALENVGSNQPAPCEVSDKAALSRAVESVARELGAEPHLRKRGDWAIVHRPKERSDVNGATEIAYPVLATVTIDKGALSVQEDPRLDPNVQADIRARLDAAFKHAKGILATSDIGHWLCDRLRAKHAVALRDSGGFYFIPKEHVPAWEQIRAAVSACSSHKIFAIPSMRSRDAIEAILSAITSETMAECNAAAEELGKGELGKRALATRELGMTHMLDKLGRYESLLGRRLEDLRAAIDETQIAIVSARMALEEQDAVSAA
jgi:hypothetical protein